MAAMVFAVSATACGSSAGRGAPAVHPAALNVPLTRSTSRAPASTPTPDALGSRRLAQQVRAVLPAYSRVTRNDERPGVSGPLDEVGATVPGGFLTVSEQRVSGVFDFSRVGMSAHRDAAGNREGFRSSSAGAQVVVQNRSGTVVNVTYTVFAGRRASLTPQKVITIAEKLSS